MGWASGFRAGSDVASRGLAIARQSNMDRDVAAVQDTKPTEIVGEDGSKSYEFFGKTYHEPLTDAQIAGQRGLALADVVAKYDPTEGARLRQQSVEFGWKMADREKADAQDREVDAVVQRVKPREGGLVMPSASFDASTVKGANPLALGAGQGGISAAAGGVADAGALRDPGYQPSARDLALADRDAALVRRDLKGAQVAQINARAAQAQEIRDAAGSVSVDEIHSLLPKLNTNDSTMPFLYAGKGKGGYTFLSLDAKGNPGDKFKLNEAQVRQLYAAHKLGEAGLGDESMAVLASTHKDIADLITKHNATLQQMATTNNAANHYSNQDALAAERNGIARQAADHQAQLGRLGATTYQTDRDGNTWAITPTFGAGGLKLTSQKVNPEGVQFAANPKPLSPKDRAEAISKLVEAGYSKEQATMSVDGVKPNAVSPDLQRMNDLVGGKVKPTATSTAQGVDLRPVGGLNMAPQTSQAPANSPRLLSTTNDGRYNVQLPDGTTALVSPSEAAAMGLIQGTPVSPRMRSNFLTLGGMPGQDF